MSFFFNLELVVLKELHDSSVGLGSCVVHDETVSRLGDDVGREVTGLGV